MEDLQIIDLFFDRNEQAIQETDAKYGRLCFSVANRILESNEDSEECVNDTWLRAWDEIPPTRPNHFSAFLCKITRILSLKKLEFSNAMKRTPSFIVSFEELESVLSDEHIAPGTEAVELGILISNFLRREKADARNVFLRKYLFFDTVEEIAERFLNEHPEFSPCGDGMYENKPMLSFFPDEHGTDGFFVAKFIKKNEG